MFELIDALATLIGTSLGIIVGCLIGLILSYAIYSSLDGHGARVELSILAFFSSAIIGAIIEASWGKK